ncbi:MATE family efflux transporter [Paracoccus sp. S-4012]|uniref:MATE family efflux transporter n=1 Tax=Paracoccus sp. S-4012 TaxID=2665648 RepID=UPI0012B02843|nr:MATE family efflux transporter [Paracoccus sp. S-4012]MRX49327.1 MATE family efflux transporter [Paracoccus sp. S-4012]
MRHLRPHVFALIALALPLIGANLARVMIGVTDTLIVGRYGVEALAALVLATSYHFILFMLGSGYAIGLMGVLAAALARGDEVEVRRATRMALWISALHSLAVLPLTWWSGPILLALGQEPRVAELAQEFLRIYGFATVPLLWGMVLNSYLANFGRANVVLWVTLAGLPLNVLLVLALVFGRWGAPQLGIAGAAIAGLIVNWLIVAALFAYAVWLPKARRFELMRNPWRPDWPAFRQVFALGLPVGLTLVAETGMFTGANVMMGWLGPTPLAAHGIALQLSSLAFMVHLGLGSAATIRVGEAAGRGDTQRIRDSAWAAIVLSVAVSSTAAAVFVLAPRFLAGLYLEEVNPATPAIMALAATLMLWAALFQLADGLQALALGLLRGVQDTRAPMLIATIAYWVVGLPVGYIAAFPLGFGPQGIWFGLLLGLAVAAVLLMRRFWGGLSRGGWTLAGSAA